MPTQYPYTASSGPLVSMIQQLRKSFPAKVDAATLKKLGIAPNNESYVLGVLRFLKIIDSEGAKADDAAKVFLKNDPDFQEAFSGLVESAYGELFELHKDGAWDLDTNGLVSFFRTSAESTQIVGQRQASTFKTLCALAGHAELSKRVSQSSGGSKPKPASTKKTVSKASEPKKQLLQTAGDQTNRGSGDGLDGNEGNPFGLTVRIEVNLPASADQDTYDRIFQSIRKNLINRSGA